MESYDRLNAILARVLEGGPVKYRERLPEQKKLFVRDRLRLLFDPDSFTEDGILANCFDPELAADGTITGIGRINGRPVAVMANDTTVKAGSWGAKSVEKFIRIQETAMRMRIPIFYLVDSAGGRITDQIELFPGRRHGGRIFYSEVKMSGVVPQICIMFGPSAAGGAYVPAFSDVVFMVEGNASMYLGSPRMAEMVVGEKVTLEEMGGARMHCTVSGCGDVLCATEEEAIEGAKRYFGYMPQHWQERPPLVDPRPPKAGKAIEEIVPEDQRKAFNMYHVIDRIVDEGSFLEIKALFARELITGLARLGGKPIGVVANQPVVKGGVLFVDSSDKGTRFVQLCDAFGLPLLFLADVSGFMIGTQVERQGIIRHGAKMISAVSEATVPKISVIVRKAYGAGLYAMCGPAFGADCTLALPTAQIAIMGPQAAINAVFYNKIAELEGAEREEYIRKKQEEFSRDIDIFRLAGELIVDHVLPGSALREELCRRFAQYEGKAETFSRRKHGVYPV